MSPEKWPMAGTWEKQDEVVIELADYLYASLDEDGWADHRNCGDPEDGMCGKEWAERSSVLNIARNLLRKFESFRPERGAE